MTNFEQKLKEAGLTKTDFAKWNALHLNTVSGWGAHNASVMAHNLLDERLKNSEHESLEPKLWAFGDM